MTNTLTNVPASVPTTNSTASPSPTVPRRFVLAAAAVVGLATVSIFTVSAVNGSDRPAEVATASIAVDVPWTLQPEEAAFLSSGASVAAAPAVEAGWTLQPKELAFITQTASPAPTVTAPECVVGVPC
jgi:hypothetical protein